MSLGTCRADELYRRVRKGQGRMSFRDAITFAVIRLRKIRQYKVLESLTSIPAMTLHDTFVTTVIVTATVLQRSLLSPRTREQVETNRVNSLKAVEFKNVRTILDGFKAGCFVC